ncbi:hypothetical protein PSMK_27410 [Phycisphaera mikurensis NBRC 102666]|uniref:Uncharacterized protein n=1 Tax=Phycisphaera mikurensis (strain NBRC 102666 / KCTC 22515 / FYK2301M01) TaxID=1142394 RepID=I0II12_PHYMF|nr:hypothetical protein PSMK_27410 [Phycisphaera mikurensis NBRC 102666]
MGRVGLEFGVPAGHGRNLAGRCWLQGGGAAARRAREEPAGGARPALPLRASEVGAFQ